MAENVTSDEPVRRKDRRVALPRRTRWLAEDLTRSWFTVPFLALVLLVATVLPGASTFVAAEGGPTALLLLFYCALLLSYPALTLLAFAGLSGDVLTVALGESRRRDLARPTWVRRMVSWRDDDVGGDGPSWPVFLALGSLVVAVWLIVAGSDSAFVVGTSVVMIALAWGGSLVAYAVHVARLDAVDGGLRFPGADAERAFSDYLYLALGVQAALGPSDVEVTTRRMRRVVSGHMLVGWTFNTVVLAALVCFLVGLR